MKNVTIIKMPKRKHSEIGISIEKPIEINKITDIIDGNAEFIGSGGFGNVFSVNINSQTYAMKLTKYDEITSKYEATLYKLFSEKNIGPEVPSKFFYYIQSENTCAIIMEMFESDLNTFINQNDLSESEISSIETQVKTKLGQMFDIGFICVDQKPANIIVKRRFDTSIRVAITDFDNKYCCMKHENQGFTECKTKFDEAEKECILAVLLIQIQSMVSHPTIFCGYGDKLKVCASEQARTLKHVTKFRYYNRKDILTYLTTDTCNEREHSESDSDILTPPGLDN